MKRRELRLLHGRNRAILAREENQRELITNMETKRKE